MSESEQPAPPALWNPNAAACWSLLFTPAFGALLHAWNADAMGRAEEARRNRAWLRATLVFFAAVLALPFFPGLPDRYFRWANYSLIVGWYLLSARVQAGHVRSAYPGGYVHKPWGKALLGGLGALLVFLTLSALAAMAAEKALGARPSAPVELQQGLDRGHRHEGGR